MRDENGKFIGFLKPRYTQVPDDLFDELMSELTGSELKVLLYVVRRIFGFKKDSDHISLSQMVNGITKKDGTIQDKGTGLHKDSVIKAVKSLVSKSVLLKNRKSSDKHGYTATEYSLNVSNNAMSDYPTRELVRNNRQAYSEKTDIQETDKQNTDITFSKPVDNSKSLQEKELLGQIMVTCKDVHSFNFYRKIVKELPKSKILRALSQVKEAQALDRVKKNPGAMFTDLVLRS